MKSKIILGQIVLEQEKAIRDSKKELEAKAVDRNLNSIELIDKLLKNRKEILTHFNLERPKIRMTPGAIARVLSLKYNARYTPSLVNAVNSFMEQNNFNKIQEQTLIWLGISPKSLKKLRVLKTSTGIIIYKDAAKSAKQTNTVKCPHCGFIMHSNQGDKNESESL